jgi:membrane-associated protease RseP (regulator of RpoE activity)
MSVAAVVIGSQLTLISDPATLPALPLEILRQSTLGGTLINDILGNGVLTVSEGARGTQAVAGMVIPLHPMAIAGYVSLFVNALALLPIGSKKHSTVACTWFEALRLSQTNCSSLD